MRRQRRMPVRWVQRLPRAVGHDDSVTNSMEVPAQRFDALTAQVAAQVQHGRLEAKVLGGGRHNRYLTAQNVAPEGGAEILGKASPRRPKLWITPHRRARSARRA